MLRLATILAAILISGSVFADAPSQAIETVDGDTVRKGDVSYRLLGYDTPETIFAECEAERRLGIKAKERLAELIDNAGEVILIEQGRKRDHYGRGLARLIIDGRDVADVLVEEGYARRYDGRTRRRGWCN